MNKAPRTYFRRWLLLWIVCLQQSPVLAVENADGSALPKQVTIGQLLMIVRENSPRYALARTQIEAAQADVVAAGVLPNPKVSYGRYDQAAGRRNTQFDGPSQQNIVVEAPILLAGQRGVRQQAAERQVDVVEANINTEYNQLLSDTWRLFVKLLAGQQRISLLEASDQDLQHLQAIITGKESAGTASRYDVLRITQEAKSLKTRLENAQTDVASTTGELAVLLGLSNWQPSAVGNLVPIGIADTFDELWQSTEKNNAQLETSRREIIAADSGLERASRERWPIPSLMFGTAFTDHPYGNTTFAGVSVDVPIFDRGQGGMAKAAAEQHAALLKRDLQFAATRQELERALDVLHRRRNTLSKAEREVLAQLPTLRQMAEDAYRLGKSSLLELLDATRSGTEIKLNHLELLEAEINAELDVMMVTGLLASSIDQIDGELAK